MKIAVVTASPASVLEPGGSRYDKALVARDINFSASLVCSQYQLTEITSEFEREFALLQPFIQRSTNGLDSWLGSGASGVISRGLYLSGLKRELRLLIDANNKLDASIDDGKVSLDIYYTYLMHPELFSSDRYESNWIRCPRFPRGKLGILFGVLAHVGRLVPVKHQP